jgi:hypothetical protein
VRNFISKPYELQTKAGGQRRESRRLKAAKNSSIVADYAPKA